MARLTIETHEHQTTYRPGDKVTGFVGWELAEAPRQAELRLFWYTQGRGTQDTRIVATQRWDRPAKVDAPLFDFQLPGGPFSFSGKLVSVLWALELVVDGEVARLDLVVSPGGREVDLTASAT